MKTFRFWYREGDGYEVPAVEKSLLREFSSWWAAAAWVDERPWQLLDTCFKIELVA